jgi:chromosome segregation ATPase
MIKKLLIGGGIAMLLGGLFFGRDAFSYLGTSIGWVKDSVKQSVPIEFEIERARQMIKNLVPDIRKNMYTIAKEEVEIERLGRQIADTESRLTQDRESILKLKADLESGNEVFQYASHKYNRSDLKSDLAHRFERYKINEATLASLREIAQARNRSLEAARRKLENMIAQKRQLEVEVQNVESRLKMVEAAQTTADYNFDDSRLGRVKELLADLHTKLEVSERLVNSDARFGGEIPVIEPVSENIVQQVTEYFDQQAAKVAAKPSHE